MKTIKLSLPWTIKTLADALEVPVDEIIKKFVDVGAPATISPNTTVDTDLGKMLGLKYCCYIEADDDGQPSH